MPWLINFVWLDPGRSQFSNLYFLLFLLVLMKRISGRLSSKLRPRSSPSYVPTAPRSSMTTSVARYVTRSNLRHCTNTSSFTPRSETRTRSQFDSARLSMISSSKKLIFPNLLKHLIHHFHTKKTLSLELLFILVQRFFQLSIL